MTHQDNSVCLQYHSKSKLFNYFLTMLLMFLV